MKFGTQLDWIVMTQLAKSLKISCIACLFIGLAALVIGIVVGLRSVFDVTRWLP